MNRHFPSPESAILGALWDMDATVTLYRERATLIDSGYIADLPNGTVRILRRVDTHYEWSDQ